MTDKLKSKLKKIQSLAERGVGGEAETAKKKLAKLLFDNDLTLEDLENEETHYYLFSYSGAPYREKLLGQIMYKVMGHESNFKVYKSKRTRNKLGIYCTPSQKIEIDLDYEFYCALFDQEVDVLMSAFISKQDIFPEDVPHNVIKLEDLSDEEKSKLLKKNLYEKNISKRHRPEGYIEEKEEQ